MRISDCISDVFSSDLLHYDISVAPDAAALRFTGEAGIGIELYAPSAMLTLNALDLSFASASLTGADGNAIPLTATTDAAAQTVTFTAPAPLAPRSEEHTSELQSLMRISYAVFCLKKKKQNTHMQPNKYH